jgi:hypothetical protein
MVFECINKTSKRTERWTGQIIYLENFGTHYELKIESRSSITVLFGKTSHGGFACIPDFGAGCHLASLRDSYWNKERLVEVLGKIDGITVASALRALSKEIDI